MTSDPANIPYVRVMIASVRGVVFGILALLVLSVVGHRFAWLHLVTHAMLAAVIALVILTWVFLFLAASREIGIGYALRQLILSVVLTPVFLIGVFAIPLLVRSDLNKWRQAGDETMSDTVIP